jgi:hypothetical protein
MLGTHQACGFGREITSPSECQAAARYLGLKQRVPIGNVWIKAQRNCWFYINAAQVYFNLADPRRLGVIGDANRHPVYRAICRGRNWRKEPGVNGQATCLDQVDALPPLGPHFGKLNSQGNDKWTAIWKEKKLRTSDVFTSIRWENKYFLTLKAVLATTWKVITDNDLGKGCF